MKETVCYNQRSGSEELVLQIIKFTDVAYIIQYRLLIKIIHMYILISPNNTTALQHAKKMYLFVMFHLLVDSNFFRFILEVCL